MTNEEIIGMLHDVDSRSKSNTRRKNEGDRHMIRTKKVTIADFDFTITFSDAGYRIRKVGTDEVYDDAVDVLEFEYEETEELIEAEPTV